MRTSVLLLSSVFLLLGLMAYFIPLPVATTQGDTAGTAWAVATALLLTGLFIFFVGLLMPVPEPHFGRRWEDHHVDHPHDYDVETEDYVVGRGRNRHVIHEKHVHHHG
ncbi:hypothetical protein HY492_00405 [Candidatus Woesearchaeota archaeon]|nr:hypothetical protein [Candidatus Woesearchaeota archaeon]